jgi:uncharacterized Zn finger protein (UPF0148 family)
MLPESIKGTIPENSLIIGEVNTGEIGKMACPSCGIHLFKYEVSIVGASCPSCDLPLVAMNKPVHEIIRSVNSYLEQRSLSKSCAYYLWNNNNTKDERMQVLMCIKGVTEPEDSVEIVSIKVDSQNRENFLKVATSDAEDDERIKHALSHDCDEDENDSFYKFVEISSDKWSSHTWCCERNVSTETGSILCDCAVMVTEDFVDEFTTFCAQNRLDVYKPDSDCFSCVWMYSGECYSYRKAVCTFVESDGDQIQNRSHSEKILLVDLLEEKLNIEPCSEWYPWKDFEPQTVSERYFYGE